MHKIWLIMTAFFTGSLPLNAQDQFYVPDLPIGTTYNYITYAGPMTFTYVSRESGVNVFEQKLSLITGQVIEQDVWTNDAGQNVRAVMPRFWITYEPHDCMYVVGECIFKRAVGQYSIAEIKRVMDYIDGVYIYRDTLLGGGPATVVEYGCILPDEFGQAVMVYQLMNNGAEQWYVLDTGQNNANGQTPYQQAVSMCDGLQQLS